MKRISSIPELEAKIDRAIALRKTRLAEAAVLDAEADEIYRAGDKFEFTKANWNRQEAAHLRHMNKATTKRIGRYSHKLAEIRTMVLPGILADDSVRV
jgi:hypothetical protein